MNKFDETITNVRSVLFELAPPMPEGQSVAPPAEPSTMPGSGDLGGMGGGMSDMGGMGGMGGEPEGEQKAPDENAAKRDADPREYTRSILSLITDPDEGITPEMFDDFVDSVSLGITKIKDKPGLKQFYGEFHKELTTVLSLREKLKSLFGQLHGVMGDLVGAARGDPDEGGGGVDRSGPSGPGVG
jgi:hypothetical protein